ncbi:MAG: ANTAR domain-containing protein, partial [Halofilum sp. (in: g-proteobacteria)]
QAHHHLPNELKRTQQTLAERKAVDRAKCLLMERHGVGEEAAYGRLRKIAMDRRLSLSAVARELLDDGR